MQLRRPGWRSRAVGTLMALAVSIPALAPAADADTMYNAGGGGVTGTAVFDVGSLPPVTAGGCTQTLDFHLENTIAPSFVFNTVFTGFVGEVDITGTGKSLVCGTASTNTGSLELRIEGRGPTGSHFICAELDGGYTRQGALVVVTVFGNCTVNDFGTGTITFNAGLLFVPMPLGAGVTGPITRADFHGAFAIVPAEGD